MCGAYIPPPRSPPHPGCCSSRSSVSYMQSRLSLRISSSDTKRLLRVPGMLTRNELACMSGLDGTRETAIERWPRCPPRRSPPRSMGGRSPRSSSRATAVPVAQCAALVRKSSSIRAKTLAALSSIRAKETCGRSPTNQLYTMTHVRYRTCSCLYSSIPVRTGSDISAKSTPGSCVGRHVRK